MSHSVKVSDSTILPGWRAPALIAMLTSLTAVSYFDRTILSIAGPQLIREFHISPTAMGTIYSALLLSYTLCMLPGGALVDRVSPRIVLTLSFVGCAILTSLTAFSGSLMTVGISVVSALLLFRLLFGIFAAPIFPATGRITANWFPPSRVGRVQAMILAGAAIGSAVSPPLFSWWMRSFGWRHSFVLAGIATGIVAIFCHAILRDRPEPVAVPLRPQPNVRISATLGLFQPLREPSYLFLITGYFCLNYFEYIFFYWIFYYLGEIRHVAAKDTTWAVTGLMLSMAVMTPLGGWISDLLTVRYGPARGRRIVPLTGLICSAVFLGCAIQTSSEALTIVMLALAFGFATAAEGPSWAAAIDFGRGRVGSSCGLFNAVGNVGGVAGPIVTPLLATYWGWKAGLCGAGVALLVNFLCWFFIGQPRPNEVSSA